MKISLDWLSDYIEIDREKESVMVRLFEFLRSWWRRFLSLFRERKKVMDYAREEEGKRGVLEVMPKEELVKAYIKVKTQIEDLNKMLRKRYRMLGIENEVQDER